MQVMSWNSNLFDTVKLFKSKRTASNQNSSYFSDKNFTLTEQVAIKEACIENKKDKVLQSYWI